MVRNVMLLMSVALGLGLAGCASQVVRLPEPRPLGAGLAAPADVLREPAVAAAPLTEQPAGLLTLDQARRLALQANPALRAALLEVRVADARRIQAGQRTNPEVAIEVEEFGGTGPRRELDSAVMTSILSHQVDLAGKRSKSERAAALETALAGWDYESRRLDVLTETTKAFIEVLAGQARLAVSAELVRIARQMDDMASQRVLAGKASPAEEARASAATSMALIEQARAERDLTVARSRMASLWGAEAVAFERADGRLDQLGPVPAQDQLVPLASQNPDVARWAAELECREAALRIEKAARIPDLTVSGGIQRFLETDDQAYLVSMSLPLPLFDRNQGRVLERERDLARAAEERRAAEAGLTVALVEAYNNLATAHNEATMLRDMVLPRVEGAFEAARASYRPGKVGYLDVLDAQRTLFEAKKQWIESLTAYHLAAADLERIVCRPLAAIGEPDATEGE
jgi:cobalt-zinc-cadmium efflux system outer membrane protein